MLSNNLINLIGSNSSETKYCLYKENACYFHTGNKVDLFPRGTRFWLLIPSFTNMRLWLKWEVVEILDGTNPSNVFTRAFMGHTDRFTTLPILDFLDPKCLPFFARWRRVRHYLKSGRVFDLVDKESFLWRTGAAQINLLIIDIDTERSLINWLTEVSKRGRSRSRPDCVIVTKQRSHRSKL
jgi:hypothetical protein